MKGLVKFATVTLLATSSSMAAFAQDISGDLADYQRDLTADVRDLVMDVQGTDAQVSDLSGNVQDMVEDSGGNIALRETEDSFVLSVASDVLFEFDSAALTQPARDTLARIAAMLAQNDGQTVQVVGHTDAKGSDEYNQRLSEERAAAVVTFLTESDVAPERLQAVGRGEAEPVAPNQLDGADNPDGRAQNRRVEFILPKN